MWSLTLTPLLLMLSIYAPLLHSVPSAETPRTKGEQAKQPPASLELTMSIVRQRYCKGSGPAGTGTLRMELQLLYRNNGHQDVILYKGSSIAYRLMVSASIEDAEMRRYILDRSITTDVVGTPEITRGSEPDKNFVILGPGATFETTASTEAVLFLKRNDEAKAADALGTGEYVLQLEVSTFPYAPSLADELRQHWKASGELWVSGIASTPMTFKIEKARTAVDCDF